MSRTRFCLTVILPVAVSVIAGILILTINSTAMTRARATAQVNAEKAQAQADISALNSERERLAADEEEYDRIIQENSARSAEITALATELEGYISDVERATARNEELDTAIADKQAYLASIGTTKPDTDGGVYKLKDDDYECEADIPAGKYRAEGSGKLYLKNIAGGLKSKVIDLSTIETNSFVFEIASGESLKVDGTVTLTELISE